MENSIAWHTVHDRWSTFAWDIARARPWPIQVMYRPLSFSWSFHAVNLSSCQCGNWLIFFHVALSCAMSWNASRCGASSDISNEIVGDVVLAVWWLWMRHMSGPWIQMYCLGFWSRWLHVAVTSSWLWHQPLSMLKSSLTFLEGEVFDLGFFVAHQRIWFYVSLGSLLSWGCLTWEVWNLTSFLLGFAVCQCLVFQEGHFQFRFCTAKHHVRTMLRLQSSRLCPST